MTNLAEISKKVYGPKKGCFTNDMIIKMDLRETGWDGADWMDMAQDRDQWRALVNTVLNLRVL
jgi:hypothetical protein